MYVGVIIFAVVFAIIVYGLITGWGSGNYFESEPTFEPDRDTDRDDIPGQGEV